MTTELTATNQSVLTMWEDPASLNEIREIFAPKLSANEFKAFVGMGKGTGLNPFLKEIWAIKYDEKAPASYFIARDGYRKSAQAHHDYDYHRVEAIYSDDLFENDNGVISHKYNFAKRGVLLGAYCLIKRKSSSKEQFVSVLLSEYDKNFSNWKVMKETMIKKVAEAQGLKAAFQEIFAGTHHEFEYQPTNQASQTEKLKETLNADAFIDKTKSTVEPDHEFKVEKPIFNSGRDDLPISDDQIDFITSTIKEKQLTDERITKALNYFKVDCIESMTDAQARLFTLQLSKL